MDPITQFAELNPNIKQVGELAYSGNIIIIAALSSITNFTDIHLKENKESVYVYELGNTGEYIAIDYNA